MISPLWPSFPPYRMDLRETVWPQSNCRKREADSNADGQGFGRSPIRITNQQRIQGAKPWRSQGRRGTGLQSGPCNAAKSEPRFYLPRLWGDALRHQSNTYWETVEAVSAFFATATTELIAAKLQNSRIKKISFHTFRHFKGTMEYAKTRDILHVMQVLGHKNIKNTLLYTQLTNFKDDEFIAKIAPPRRGSLPTNWRRIWICMRFR